MRGLIETLEGHVAPLGAYPEWVLGLLWLGIFFIAMLIAMWLIGRSREVSRDHVTNSSTAVNGPVDVCRDILRVRRGLRELHLVEDTSPLYKLPGGVWGFTMRPGDTTWPILRHPQPGLFEVHKLEDGSIEVVGYASVESPGEAAWVELVLYPEMSPGAPHFVSIPLARVARASERASDDTAVLDLLIAPVGADLPESKPPGREEDGPGRRRAETA